MLADWSTRRLSRRAFGASSLVAISSGTLAAVAACAAPSRTPAAPAAPAAGVGGAAPAPVALKTAYTTTSSSMAPIWLAMEAGGFAAEGIDAELTFIGAGQAILG